MKSDRRNSSHMLDSIIEHENSAGGTGEQFGRNLKESTSVNKSIEPLIATSKIKAEAIKVENMGKGDQHDV